MVQLAFNLVGTSWHPIFCAQARKFCTQSKVTIVQHWSHLKGKSYNFTTNQSYHTTTTTTTNNNTNNNNNDNTFYL